MKHISSLIMFCATAFLLFEVVCEPKIVGCSIYDPWTPKAEMIDIFKSLCNNHSTQASYESAGKSYLGNDIWIFRFGNPDGEVVLWDGQLHGNEDYGTEILWLMAQWLFSGDPQAESILQTNYVLMIPIVNIDVWGRYNARDVNLNRNFETGWSASAENPGPYPFSEPETKVMRNVFQTYRPSFYVNLHQGASKSYFAYYSESDRTVADQVLSRAGQIANELGVTPYRGFPMRSTGFAIGDAFSLVGASSWLAEVDPGWVHTDENWQRLVNTMYPKCLAMFIAMCEISANEPIHTPPIVVSHVPDVDAVDVLVTATVEVTFSEAMDTASTEAAFSVDSVVGTFIWNLKSTVMTFTPDSALDYETVYTATITTNAMDQQGANMEAFYSWSFTTEAESPPVDTTPPEILITSPENKAYATNHILLTFTSNESVSWMAYSLDGQANVTITGNTTIAGLSDGAHTITVHTNDTAGNIGSSISVYFTIDTVLPNIEILSPQNTTYTTSSVPLSFTVDEATSWIGYSLDEQANVTITANTTISNLPDGSHSLVVYAKDTAGNTGASDMVYFTIETQQPEPFPIWIVGVVGVVVIAIAFAAIFLWRRRK